MSCFVVVSLLWLLGALRCGCAALCVCGSCLLRVCFVGLRFGHRWPLDASSYASSHPFVRLMHSDTTDSESADWAAPGASFNKQAHAGATAHADDAIDTIAVAANAVAAAAVVVATLAAETTAADAGAAAAEVAC